MIRPLADTGQGAGQTANEATPCHNGCTTVTTAHAQQTITAAPARRVARSRSGGKTQHAARQRGAAIQAIAAPHRTSVGRKPHNEGARTIALRLAGSILRRPVAIAVAIGIAQQPARVLKSLIACGIAPTNDAAVQTTLNDQRP